MRDLVATRAVPLSDHQQFVLVRDGDDDNDDNDDNATTTTTTTTTTRRARAALELAEAVGIEPASRLTPLRSRGQRDAHLGF
jgi:hypothetical protein